MSTADISPSSHNFSLLEGTREDSGFLRYEVPGEAPSIIPLTEYSQYVINSIKIAAIEGVNSSNYVNAGEANAVSYLDSYFHSLDLRYDMCPPVFACTLQNIFLKKGLIYPFSTLSGHAMRIYEMNRACDRPACPDPGGLEIMCGLSEYREIKPHNTFQKCLVVSSAGSFNYGHWIVDDLSRVQLYIAYLLARGIELPFESIVISSYGSKIDQVREEGLLWLLTHLSTIFPERADSLGKVRVDLVDFNALMLIGNATVISPSTYHPVLMREDALLGLRNLANLSVQTAKCSESSLAKKIFVSRRGTRMLANNLEIENLLIKLGFTVIYPEDISFESQIKVFGCADIIIGIMGAAMTNVVFSQPDTKVVFLTYSEWPEPFYRTLVNALSLRAWSVLGSVVVEKTGLEPHLQSFSIDASLLETLICAIQAG